MMTSVLGFQQGFPWARYVHCCVTSCCKILDQKVAKKGGGHAFIIKKIKIIVSVLMVSVLMFAVLDYCLINYSRQFPNNPTCMIVSQNWKLYLFNEMKHKSLAFYFKKKKTTERVLLCIWHFQFYAVCNRISFYVYTKHIAFALK
jgi:hypothetical protein